MISSNSSNNDITVDNIMNIDINDIINDPGLRSSAPAKRVLSPTGTQSFSPKQCYAVLKLRSSQKVNSLGGLGTH